MVLVTDVRTRNNPPVTEPSRFSHLELCARAGEEVDRVTELVAGADLAAKVPWSRVWRLEELAHHVGAIHRWAAELVATEARRYRPIRETDDWRPGLPADDVAGWLRTGGDHLVSVLAAADPERRAWAWGVDQHVRFWSRRMTHETGIHRADAELALGLMPTFDPQVAADGMSEFLENLWKARAWRRDMGALRGAGESVSFVATDVGERWDVERTPAGFSWVHTTSGRRRRSDVTVSGSVSDLYLFVWKRLPPENAGLTVRGDRAGLSHWLRYSAV